MAAGRLVDWPVPRCGILVDISFMLVVSYRVFEMLTMFHLAGRRCFTFTGRTLGAPGR